MQKRIEKGMGLLGWVFVQNGPDSFSWKKFNEGGKPIANQDDAVWEADLASCMMETGRKQVVEDQDIVRVFRLLEYVGPRKWVEATLQERSVKERRNMANNAWIAESFLTRYPEPVSLEELVGKEESKLNKITSET